MHEIKLCIFLYVVSRHPCLAAYELTKLFVWAENEMTAAISWRWNDGSFMTQAKKYIQQNKGPFRLSDWTMGYHRHDNMISLKKMA